MSQKYIIIPQVISTWPQTENGSAARNDAKRRVSILVAWIQQTKIERYDWLWKRQREIWQGVDFFHKCTLSLWTALQIPLLWQGCKKPHWKVFNAGYTSSAPSVIGKGMHPRKYNGQGKFKIIFETIENQPCLNIFFPNLRKIREDLHLLKRGRGAWLGWRWRGASG